MRDELINALLDTLIETAVYVDFYGAVSPISDNGDGAFRLGLRDNRATALTFVVKCDPEDGYRSSMEGVFYAPPDDDTIFFANPIARVRAVKLHEADADMWALIGDDEHIWLKWGTNHSDSYYPWFVFDYEPKKEFTQ